MSWMNWAREEVLRMFGIVNGCIWTWTFLIWNPFLIWNLIHVHTPNHLEVWHQYVSLQDSCVWHDSACTPQKVNNSDWICFLINGSEDYWYQAIIHILSPAQVWGDATWCDLVVIRLCNQNHSESVQICDEILWQCGCASELFDLMNSVR